MVYIGIKIIRERLVKRLYTLGYANYELNMTDMFTKALPVGRFAAMTARLILRSRSVKDSVTRDSKPVQLQSKDTVTSFVNKVVWDCWFLDIWDDHVTA
ncbi:hypothetical protein OXX80_003894 [Metschnikowia pulcherrima]